MFPNTTQFITTPQEVEALCQSCGACCTSFRVSFYWAETTAHPLGTVPEALTTPISASRVCMNGTSTSAPRCCALQGEIGQQVSCSIYPLRSSTCKDYEVFLSDGRLNPRCNSARQKNGLVPLDVYFLQVDKEMVKI